MAEGIRRYKPSDEYLLHVGCVRSYEERGQRMVRALAELLGKVGVSFGILGAEENCDGNEVYMLGEIGLFQELAKKNARNSKNLA